MPIRNVLRHLTQVARDEPDQLADVFEERQGTIDSSITYLEDLASNYARLYPRVQRLPCDVDVVVHDVVSSAGSQGNIELHAELDAGGATVVGAPVALRRIVENLIDNAIDSLGDAPGSVAVATLIEDSGNGTQMIRVSVSDTGCGMSEDQVAQIFDDFFTTKENGTGLGLSIVRRLVLDLNGSIRVESEAGQGSRFIVDLPVSDTAAGSDANSREEDGA
jgi:signal transduction histidine kinase